MISCLNISLRRADGGINASFERLGGELGAEFNKSQDCGIAASFGIVCSADLGDWRRLMTLENYVLTIKGGYMYLKKM